MDGWMDGYACVHMHVCVVGYMQLYQDILPARYIAPMTEDCAYFPFKTGLRNLTEVFNHVTDDDNTTFYVGWSNCDSSAVKKALRSLYTRPHFLSHPHLAMVDTDWIFIGTPGPGAPAHYDAIFDPSWQAQLTGQKHWALTPPPECARVCKPVSIMVNAGDVVVVDTHRWLHETRVIGTNRSMTIGSEYYRRGTVQSDGYTDQWDTLELRDGTLL